MTARNERADIARGALMILVVWGHLLESEGFDGRLYFAIYMFHIPAFAMISGLMSKSVLNADEALKLLKRVLIPLLVFQVAYFVALGYLAPHRVLSITTPVWIIWFLFSLLTWKFLLPVALKLPYPFLLSLIIALAVGMIDDIGAAFSLSRTLVFFPAFIFGHLYGKRSLAVSRQHRMPLAALFGALFVIALLVSGHVDIRWLWGAAPYVQMPLETPGVAYRGLVITVGILMSVAFLAALPSRSVFLATLGKKTMPIYLLHGFPVMLYWASGFKPDNTLLFLVFTGVMAVVISALMAWLGTWFWSRWKPNP